MKYREAQLSSVALHGIFQFFSSFRPRIDKVCWRLEGSLYAEDHHMRFFYCLPLAAVIPMV